MDKAWLMEQGWAGNSSEEEENKTNFTFPLPEGLKHMIFRELHKFTNIDHKEVMQTIEKVVEISEGNNLYNNLNTALTETLGEQVKPFVSRILMYKKKACRDGSNCKRKENCIFSHKNDNKESENSDDWQITKNNNKNNYEQENKNYFKDNFERNKRIFNNDLDDNAKRRNLMNDENDNFTYTEVIFNRVPIELCDVENIRYYAGLFGNVREVKNLKDGKYLIKYASHEDAKKMVNSQEFVMGNENIKKFFNKFARRTTEDDLFDLLEKQDEIIRNMIRSSENKEHMGKLSWITNRIKSVVLNKNNVVEKKRVENNYQKESLFLKSNFTK
ncbi:hypothetical protein GVAV_002267 [Gurleya vavrai]